VAAVVQLLCLSHPRVSDIQFMFSALVPSIGDLVIVVILVCSCVTVLKYQ